MDVPPPFSYEKIDALLLKVARELPRRPDWYARLARLDRSAMAETRLPVYQAVRDSGCLPEDAGFFLVSYAVEDISLDGQRTMRRVREEMAWMEEAGDTPDFDDDELDDDELDDDDLDEDEAEDEFEEDDGGTSLRSAEDARDSNESRLRPDESIEEWDDRMRRASVKRHVLKNLAANGELEMADLCKRHADEFRHRHEKGQRFFFEPPEPGAAELRGAVQELYDHVRQCVGSRLPMGPLACRWSTDYGFVDLQIFPTPMELVGGPLDGAVVDPDVDFDLLRIQEAFDSVDGVGWTLDGEDREFHYVCFRGTYRRHEVWVTVFAGAPTGEKPTIKSDELRKWRAYRGGAAE